LRQSLVKTSPPFKPRLTTPSVWFEFDVTNRKFVFKIDMGLIDVSPDASDYNAARGLINQPGDYSITHIYLDFTYKSNIW